MNYNILAYSIFLPTISVVTIKTGWVFYKNGTVFLFKILQNATFAKQVNNLLLIGYYLVNIGYTIFSISLWQNVSNVVDLINSLTKNMGLILLVLATLHFNNIFWIIYLNKSNIKI
ncbi:hypothetical protein PW52_00985 [Tamlana sedimentorum]|uniref:Uncharacterized protein n=1 Tax=Neotamlana sedimentorum TaxID=1435349 RepID=A0A0D7WD24_9FLAO|nr:hypothetical protein [Tamlana sedimentorum]KJD37065.1 hypothetical protein PW52_00985 [Tamlana sedimentorum]